MSLHGSGDFRSGQTTKTRVYGPTIGPTGSRSGERFLRQLAGFTARQGEAKPERVPTRLGTAGLTALTEQVPFAFVDDTETRIIMRDSAGQMVVIGDDGAWDSQVAAANCTLSLNPLTEIACGAGDTPVANDAIIFGTTVGDVVAGTIYYVHHVHGAGSFAITQSYGGAEFVFSTGGGAASTFRIITGDTIGIVTDSAPVRIGALVVYATKGADPKLMSFEPDSASTKTRPFSFKSPQDYDKETAPVVTRTAPTPTRLFQISSAPNYFSAVGTGCTEVHASGGVDYPDYDDLVIGPTAVASQVGWVKDVTACDCTNAVYLMLDIDLRWSVGSPSAQIESLGNIVMDPDQRGMTRHMAEGNIDTLEKQYENAMAWAGAQFGGTSGLQISLYSEDSTHPGGLYLTEHKLASYELPRFNEQGLVTRIIIHLGTHTGWASQIVKAVSFDMTSSFAPPPTLGSWTVRVHASTYSSDYKYAGNFLFGPTTFQDSPWTLMLPSNQGTTVNTSAVVLEEFPLSYSTFDPDHPAMKYAAVYRGRDQLSTADYRVMVSNPSAESSEVFPCPWSTYSVAFTIPADSDAKTIITEYANYATDVLLYRTLYYPLATDNLGELGVWSEWEYLGQRTLAASITYKDTRRKDVACTTVNAGDTVSCTAHGLQQGDAITFGLVAGGMRTGVAYFIIAAGLTADVFQFSTEPQGTAFVIDATAGANTWSSAAPEPTVDQMAVPQIMATNRDYADSACYLAVADAQLYTGRQTWNNSTSKWTLPLGMRASNEGDYSSFPTAPSEDTEETDGTELGEFAPDGVRIVGLLARDRSKFAFTNNAFYELEGGKSADWQFVRRDTIGCVSAKTIVDCRSVIIWHDGTGFYAYAGGPAHPISDGLVDSTLIDWTQPHQAVYCDNRYILFCHLATTVDDSHFTLLIYDLPTLENDAPGWRMRHSASYQLVGMCTDGVDVYGITTGGDVVNVFGGTTDYNGAQLYEIDYQYQVVADPLSTRKVAHVVANLITDQASINVEIRTRSQGLATETDTQTHAVTSSQTQYRWRVPVKGDAADLRLRYTGAYPPTVGWLGLDVDDASLG